MIKKNILLLIIFAFFKKNGFSNQNTITSWVNEIISSDINFKPFPYNVVFIEKLQPQKNTEILNITDFNQYGFLKHIKTKNINWSFKLNRFDQNQKKHEKENEDVYNYRFFSRLADLDTVFYMPKNNYWKVMKANSSGNIEKLEEKGLNLNTEHIYEWFSVVGGFNGVVLDKKKDFLLVGSTKKLLSLGEQAVVYQQSYNNLRLKKETTEASAIVECVDYKNGYGIFHILLYGSEVHSGDKIIIVKKNKSISLTK